MRYKQWLVIGMGSILIAVLAHAFFFYEWMNNRFMVGPNDGLGQIVPFKHFLYNQYKKGEFFYSFQFGIGGGIYAQLAYYFSTSTIFYITCLLVYLGEAIGFFNRVDPVFWGQAAVFINTIRLSLVLVIATYVFHYMKIALPYAFFSAFLYGVSIMYFGHAIYWEFFTDCFLWLPLLVLGVEKLIREENPFWLVLAMSLTLLNNFYFAYVNFVFISLYVPARWLIQLPEDRLSFQKQLGHYVLIVLLSFMIGAIAFIPAVSGFLNNYRPEFTGSISLFELHDNILYESRYLLLPPLFVLFVFIKNLYRDKTFLLFTSIALLFVVFHYSPFIASAFNGFSAPQFRFEYIGVFAISGAVGKGLTHLKHATNTQLILGGAGLFTIYMLGNFFDERVTFSLTPPNHVFIFALWAAAIGASLLSIRKSARRLNLLCVVMVLFHLVLVNSGARLIFSETGFIPSHSFMTSRKYHSDEQSSLIHQALDENRSLFARTEWMTDTRNNTPLIQGFYGNSAYSSVLNGDILRFYYDDLEIDMGRESVSRFSGFGDRTHLHSLMQVQYKLVDKYRQTPIPYGFRPHSENEGYILYENKHVLPFARATSITFQEKDLNRFSPLVREHAMLKGIILENGEANGQVEDLYNLMETAQITAIGGTYEKETLHITENVGGIDITIGERRETEIDDYFSFFLQNQSKTAPLFTLKINDYETTRKSRSSVYKTDINAITVRIPSNNVISLRVPKGNYTLKNLGLRSESYQVLQEAYERDHIKQIDVEVDGRNIHVNYDNTVHDTYLALPIPYEKGWEVKVNGKKQPLQKVNYAFLGSTLYEGVNEITFSYLPPYFRLAVTLSSLGLLGAGGWLRHYRQKRRPQ
ncbi:YfhO family protein [Shouchella patagoniensis]|uniref:YfhO family protein n=1 Tax=Shouchella patagoniensis TaxID=228576 RepID=UPI000995DA44|nr:YfhO family protein [Shouchella patagoniensis]